MILKSGTGKIIVGYDLGNVNSQISYYSAQTSKVETAPSVSGTQIYHIPTVLCKKYGVNQWLYGKEALRVAEEDEGILVDNLLELAIDGEMIRIEEEIYDPVSLLTLFVRKSLSLLSMVGTIDRIGAFLITCERMDSKLTKVLEKVLSAAGLKARHICFQSYEESFYQYMIHQEEELWRFATVMFQWEGSVIKAYRMQCNGKTVPKAVFISETEFAFETKEQDRTFLQIVKTVCGEHRISAAYLIGEGFDQERMKESLRYLCRESRVFLGSNLFSQGACLGMMERLRPSRLGKGHVFLGKNQLKANIGMRVLRQGADSYLALLDAGVNWFEAEADRECYVKEEKELEFVVTPLNGQKGKIAHMTLEGLESGPARLFVHLKMIGEDKLCIAVEDLGFGEFRQATHRTWQEELSLYE